MEILGFYSFKRKTASFVTKMEQSFTFIRKIFTEGHFATQNIRDCVKILENFDENFSSRCQYYPFECFHTL